ncbi:nitrogen regulation protein NR(II) [Geothrix sp. 21YS21S-4]|uniref:two-component system sensor histidine kinase NtrB n=1 Tax=Geothrix sp. 21YS21S-4 TaxID=3068889 RepID=UPI0027BB0D8B|nr:PAS domain-containing sensor histidine kinase [Geothrix sp. 21YS21S-4]
MAEPPFIRLSRRGASPATVGGARIAVMYALASGLWILVSDRLLEAMVPDAARRISVGILKGWAFVILTAIILFLMVRRLLGQAVNRETRLHTLIHAIPDLVWVKDADGLYQACNQACERFFGAKEADILGRRDEDFIPPELADTFRRKDREAILADGPTVEETWVTFPHSGERVLLETLRTPLRRGTAVTGVLGISRDITVQDSHIRERARLEGQLHQAQKMETVGRFAGGIAHDYNNMLGVILANADLALYQMAADRPERKYLEDIAKAARHSAELTGQMLAFARQEPAHPVEVDLERAVEGLLGVLGGLVGARIEVRWRPQAGLWPVRVDPTQLERVITNLVVNARDAIPGEGRIGLTARNVALTPKEASAWEGAEPGDYAMVEVADSGSGMAPEVLPHIFEPFFTTKSRGKGTGLGLALVHSIVKQNRGAIRVESEPDRGTTFRILLPRDRAAEGPGEPIS